MNRTASKKAGGHERRGPCMGHPHQGQGHVAGHLSGRTTPRPFPPPTPQLLPESKSDPGNARGGGRGKAWTHLQGTFDSAVHGVVWSRPFPPPASVLSWRPPSPEMRAGQCLGHWGIQFTPSCPSILRRKSNLAFLPESRSP